MIMFTEDNFDNSVLKGDSGQGFHLPDPSGFSRSDCQPQIAFHSLC